MNKIIAGAGESPDDVKQKKIDLLQTQCQIPKKVEEIQLNQEGW